MLSNVTFEQIEARLSCETTLPQIPLAAMRLSEMVDHELISQDVLRVTASDPGLTAGLLRSASSPLYALSPKPVADVRTALSILGVRGVKSVAMSVLMQSVMGGCTRAKLDSQRFVQHSTFVGIMAKYVFLRRKQIHPFTSNVNADEVFAAGILHDLGLGLIAVSFPPVYDECLAEAVARRMTTQQAFIERFGRSVNDLTVAAFHAWKLPAVFSDLIAGAENIEGSELEQTASAALVYSDWIAQRCGFSERNEPADWELDEAVLLLAQLPEDELAGAVQQVTSHTQSCLTGQRAA